MLHHAEAGHLELRLELRERAAVALEEPVEQVAPRRVGESLEDAVVVVHLEILRDQKVTCQEKGLSTMSATTSRSTASSTRATRRIRLIAACVSAAVGPAVSISRPTRFAWGPSTRRPVRNVIP